VRSDSCLPTHEKDKKQEETVDKIRQKYGRESITNGAILTTDIGIKDKKVKK
jgi:hypothetical protein